MMRRKITTNTISAEEIVAGIKARQEHDTIIKAANWAMKEDPECVAAHQSRMVAKEELKSATRHEIPEARVAFTAADAEWRRVTMEVFRRSMA
jgi:hypothetical protein